MKLDQAQRLASRILDSARGYTLRAEIAGSIRRLKEECKDIEIVAIPLLGEKTDLFEESRRNLLYRWARQMEREDKIHWIKPGTNQIQRWPIEEHGKYWRGLLVKSGVKLDLFLTTQETWGCTLLIRTGPSDYSTRIVSQCRPQFYFAQGKLFNGDGRFIPTPEEKDVYTTLAIPYIKPKQR